MFAADLIRALGEFGHDQRVAVLSGEDGGLRFAAPTAVLGGGRRGLSPRAVARLRRSVSAWSPHVVQAHGGQALKYGSLAAGRSPVVYRKIGMAAPWARSGPRRSFQSALLRRAGLLVAVSEEARREAVDTFGVPEARTLTIPNAVDGRRIAPGRHREEVRAELGLPEDAGVVLSVAALTWEKDPVGHVNVVERVLGRLPRTVLALVGDGPLRKATAAAVRSRGLQGSVRLLGERADLPELLAASDVLLLASPAEGMPGSLIEAGMAGVPAVAYDLAGVREVVVDGVTGRLASPADPEALAAALTEVLGDDQARAKMGRAASDRCRSRFDIAAVAPAYASVYAELAGRREARR
jgi:glycosyltransferase involved in cell wall biosynthesis